MNSNLLNPSYRNVVERPLPFETGEASLHTMNGPLPRKRDGSPTPDYSSPTRCSLSSARAAWAARSRLASRPLLEKSPPVNRCRRQAW